MVQSGRCCYLRDAEPYLRLEPFLFAGAELEKPWLHLRENSNNPHGKTKVILRQLRQGKKNTSNALHQKLITGINTSVLPIHKHFVQLMFMIKL